MNKTTSFPCTLVDPITIEIHPCRALRFVPGHSCVHTSTPLGRQCFFSPLLPHCSLASRPRLNPCLLFMGSFVEWCGWDEKWVQSILCLPATNNLFVSPGSSPTKRSWLGSQRQCLWVVRCRFLQRCCSESHVCPVH